SLNKKNLGNTSDLRINRVIAEVDCDLEQNGAGPSFRASEKEKSSVCETTEAELVEAEKKREKKLKKNQKGKVHLEEKDFVELGSVGSEYFEKENLTAQEKETEDSDLENDKKQNAEMWYVEDESGDWELAGIKNMEQQKGECSNVENENKEWANSDTESAENEYVKLLNGEIDYPKDAFLGEQDTGKSKKSKSKKKSKKKSRKKKTLYVEEGSELKNGEEGGAKIENSDSAVSEKNQQQSENKETQKEGKRKRKKGGASKDAKSQYDSNSESNMESYRESNNESKNGLKKKSKKKKKLNNKKRRKLEIARAMKYISDGTDIDESRKEELKKSKSSNKKSNNKE
ncbi:hypothetical protein PCYB_081080, partial [Plasmodium cynomolgi strain B]